MVKNLQTYYNAYILLQNELCMAQHLSPLESQLDCISMETPHLRSKPLLEATESECSLCFMNMQLRS